MMVLVLTTVLISLSQIMQPIINALELVLFVLKDFMLTQQVLVAFLILLNANQDI
jgi:hypothetical protein